MGCIFLSDQGCIVHPDRPLVCRLYPLGQTIDAEGKERFGRMPPQPDCKGLYDKDSTVGEYLKSQGVAPYLRMEKRYTALYQQIETKLASIRKETTGFEQVNPDDVGNFTEVSGQTLQSPLLDIDATIESYCKKHRIKPPVNFEEMVTLHIKSIEDWLLSLIHI